MTRIPFRRWTYVVAAVAVIALAVWKLRPAAPPKAASPAKPQRGPMVRQVTVSLTQSLTGPVREKLLLTGALKPKETVDVTPKATGRVERIYVNVGDLVRSGALIAELEDDELQQQVNRAEAALAVARAARAQREAELSNAKAELERAEQLRHEGLISAQDLEARRTSFQVFQAQVRLAQAQGEQAEAELRELKIRLSQTKIYAPINGHIAQRYVDVGALVSPATPIVRLVNLGTLITAASVPEREVGKLRVGNQAVVHVDAFGDRSFSGRVARIGPVLDAATRSATIEIEIANPEYLLKAEMFARVELDLGSTRQAVLIPREALVYRGQQPGVYLLDGNRPVFRPIETGLTQGDHVEVLSNLAPGVTLVGRGASMLTEGDRIVVPGRERPRGAGNST
ncbi:MAG: efflux RND transporter periplasmic adaptor subunit [Bryobacteraceae bacterium]|nr:efflux RND transporter periplasmic adaptor subunit [Bryobacteraceae bacterium]